MRYRSLTPKQYALLEYIDAYIREKGYPPLQKEMAVALGISPEAARKRLVAIEEKGFVARRNGWLMILRKPGIPQREVAA